MTEPEDEEFKNVYQPQQKFNGFRYRKETKFLRMLGMPETFENEQNPVLSDVYYEDLMGKYVPVAKR